MTNPTCPVCGSPVEVAGKTTHYYVPLVKKLASLVDGAKVAVELSDINEIWREVWLLEAHQALSEYRKEKNENTNDDS